SNVDLPQPDGPSSVTNSPAATLSDVADNTSRDPVNRTATSVIRSSGPAFMTAIARSSPGLRGSIRDLLVIDVLVAARALGIVADPIVESLPREREAGGIS